MCARALHVPLRCGSLLGVLSVLCAVSASPGLSQSPVPPAVPPELVLQTGHRMPNVRVAFSPDGATVASAGLERAVRLWDAETGALRRVIHGHSQVVRALAFSPDGAVLATGTSRLQRASDGRGLYDPVSEVRLWNARTGELIRTLAAGLGSSVRSIAFSSGGKWLAAANGNRQVWLWDWKSGRMLRTLEHPEAVETVAFAPDGELLASATVRLEGSRPSGEVRLWNPADGTLLRTLSAGDGTTRVEGLAFSADGALIAGGTARRAGEEKTGEVVLWDARTGIERRRLSGGLFAPRSLVFSPNGDRLAAGSSRGELRIWEPTTGRLRRTLHGFSGAHGGLAFAPDGNRLAAGGREPSVEMWNAARGKRLWTSPGSVNPVYSLAVSPDGRSIAAGTEDDTTFVWAGNTGRLRRILRDNHTVQSLAYSPDGALLATASGGSVELVGGDLSSSSVLSGSFVGPGRVRLWDARTGQPRRRLSQYADVVAFSSDGRWLASEIDSAPAVWEARSGKLARRFAGPGLAETLAFSPDGSTLAVGDGSGSIHLWDASSGTPRNSFAAHGGLITSLAFSPRGSALASAGMDGTIRLWDPLQARELRMLAGHEGPVLGVAFSPDGRWLASCGVDGTVRVWDASTGAQRRLLTDHLEVVRAVAFSRDGQRLISGSFDGSVKIRSADGARVLATLMLLPRVRDGAPREWIAYTPEGYYHGSGEAERFLRWRVGDRLGTTNRFRKTYHQPERVRQALGLAE